MPVGILNVEIGADLSALERGLAVAKTLVEHFGVAAQKAGFGSLERGASVLDGLKSSAAGASSALSELEARLRATSGAVGVFSAGFASGIERTRRGGEVFGEVSQGMARDFYAAADAVQARMNRLVAAMDMSALAAAAGSDTARGYVFGLLSRVGEMERAGAELGRAQLRGYKRYNIQNSPARRMIDTAQQTAESYILGFEKTLPKAMDTGEQFARALHGGVLRAGTGERVGFDTAKQNIVARIPNGIDTASFGGTEINITLNNSFSPREMSRAQMDYQSYKIQKDIQRIAGL